MRRRYLVYIKAVTSLVIISLVVACGVTTARNPVPITLSSQVTPLGLSNVRFWGDEIPANFDALVSKRVAQIRAARPHLARPGTRPAFSSLTISGGGSDGAFGAGLLVGWSKAGGRPQFEIVTGISIGALVAPFVFLGTRYDPVLKAIFTQYATDDLLKAQPIRGMMGGSSLASNKPLARLIAKYIDQALMAEIAKAHATGRRLLVGTTNLDAQRPVIWDMGEIASSGRPEAIHLFRNVLLASAAIPGVFPPVLMNVTTEGRTYDEMHVDGSTTHQVFLLPGQIQTTSIDKKSRIRPRRSVYVIRNGRVAPEHKVVKAGTLSIATRSVKTLTKYMGIGDLTEMYYFARRNRIDFRLAYIPGEFPDTSQEPFDMAYMTKLYNLGYRLGAKGYNWKTRPPGAGPARAQR